MLESYQNVGGACGLKFQDISKTAVMDVLDFPCVSQSGCMTVQVAEAHAHVQRLVSVVKMATMLVECRTEEQEEVAETTIKDFYAADFETMVKRCNKGITISGGYVEK